MIKPIPPDRKSPPVRIIIGMVASLVFPFLAEAEINSAFSMPAYMLNETVVGIKGGEVRYKEPYPIYADPNGATRSNAYIDYVKITPLVK